MEGVFILASADFKLLLQITGNFEGGNIKCSIMIHDPKFTCLPHLTQYHGGNGGVDNDTVRG